MFTTPFEVYANRKGVCQDFANLFICLARLLGVPSRYVCGYIYTGQKNPNQRQGEASHAWVSVFVPGSSWLSFDPTNDMIPSDGHVTLAWGRDFSDVTPVKGIAVGGGEQTVEVEVRVVPIEEPAASSEESATV